MRAPAVRFVDTPEGRIAYQVTGEGPVDLWFWMPGVSNLDLIWEAAPIERYLRRISSFSRLIIGNARGIGMADPIQLGAPPTMEQWAMDLWWILDAAGAERVALFATGELGPFALWTAATFPDRIRSLVLLDSFATLVRHDDYPWGIPLDVLRKINEHFVAEWGTGRNLALISPELVDERGIDWWGRLERNTLSQAVTRHIRTLFETIDTRSVLASIQAPTLVISHAENAYIRPEHGRYLAEHIPNARYVERPGPFTQYWTHDTEWVLDEVERFLTGTRASSSLEHRVLATVVFTDIVRSTELASSMGDAKWSALMDRHDDITRRQLERFRGRQVKSTGDGVLATFDGPARAIRCAMAIRDELQTLGIQIRTGVHTGEIEMRQDDLGGIAVAIGARVMAAAGPGEVLVSGAVPPLVAGSGLEFEDRGARVLKGVPGEWRLLAVREP